ncbi:MAG: hypothetical protein E7200_10850 [Selenomonas ruminantium]|nr:hypothetical protein [Selenomonas ruminantium]
MAELMERYLHLYGLAYGAYKAGEWNRAESLRHDLDASCGESLRSLLLKAYIERDSEKIVSELQTLLHLLDIFAPEGATQETGLVAEAWSLLGSACARLGEHEESTGAFLASAELESDPRQRLAELSNAIFSLNYRERTDPTDWKLLYGRYARELSAVLPYERRAYGHGKLRIGYLSADFRLHPVLYFVWGLLTQFDSDHFEVYLYSSVTEKDSWTDRLKELPVQWREIAELTDEAAARQIRADEIDILFELGGHSKGNRLGILAYRPAAVQLSGIGYMGSTGLPAADYFLTDRYCSERASNPYFTEKLLPLPRTHFCFTPLTDFPELGEPSCLSSGYVTFGSFNNFAKVTDAMLQLWAEILRSVPGSRLLLKHKLLGCTEGREWAEKKLFRAGIELTRVELRGFSRDYRKEYNELDIALDTFPYTGGQTTCEALYMGVPVVTLSGQRPGSRFGWSLLQNLELSECCASTAEEYVQKAVSLASDRKHLAELHGNLRKRMQASPLMQADAYVRDVEQVYMKIYDDFCGMEVANEIY